MIKLEGLKRIKRMYSQRGAAVLKCGHLIKCVFQATNTENKMENIDKGENMKLGDVKGIIYDKICLYNVFNFKNIWKGYIKDIPCKYLDLEIKIIGANRNMVDIGVVLSQPEEKLLENV